MKIIKVVCAIIIKDNDVLIAQRSSGEFCGLWEFPGGKIEEKETAPEALTREIREELNMEINILNYFTTIEYDYTAFHLSMICYICTAKNMILELNVHSNCKWLPLEASLKSIPWVPADAIVFDFLQEEFKSNIY